MSEHKPTTEERRKFLLSVGAPGGAVMLSSTVPLRSALAQGKPPTINVGQIAPMTGAAAEFGPYYRDAVQLAINHINAAATTVLGGPIIDKHVTVDTTTIPTVGV